MIVAKKALSRRTVLRGLGTALALPLLDGMVPALTAQSRTAARPVQRLGAIYMPNGMVMDAWTPAEVGDGFAMTPILKPLAPFRDRLLLLSGLNGAKGAGAHSGASTRFLTGVTYRGLMGGMDLSAGISVDQVVARQLGASTQLASLELALDRNDLPGACDANYSCAYTHTIAWRSATTPLPMEHNPRAVFERLFGDSGTTDTTVRLAQFRRERSVLDAVLEKIGRLRQQLGPDDRGRVDEYLEAVRDVERRIRKAEEQGGRDLPVVAQPAGVPDSYEDHAKLMFDLQVLAYQTDLTRVVTFMVGRELSARAFPEIDVAAAWHATSHHGNDPARLAILTRIQTYHSGLLAYYLDKLEATRDGDGSLLDHVTILYGCGMSDSDRHDPLNLPLLLAGGGSGGLKGGRHLKYGNDTPMANLLVTLMDHFGVPLDSIGNSTGRLAIEPLSLL